MIRTPVWSAVALMVIALAASARAQPAELQGKAREAAAAMESGRYDEAAAIYRDLSRALPDEAGLLMNLGMALALGGHEAEAIKPLEQAVKRDPSLLPAQLFLGTARLALGYGASAVAPLEHVARAHPDDAQVRQMLAAAYTAAERIVPAVRELEAVARLDPSSPEAWYSLAQGYNAIAQDALASFDADDDAAPWRRLLVADALAADGRFTDAFALYREMLPGMPDAAGVHDAIAGIYDRTGHADWAIVERQRGTPSPATCASQVARCAFRDGRHDEALAAALEGEEPAQRYWRARAAAELARAAFARLDALPDSRERREARGALARTERRYADAVTEYTAALGFAPGDPSLVEELGTAQYLARDYAAAIATLGPLAARQPNNVQLYAVFGDALLQAQRTADAIGVLERAVGLDPLHEAARASLARAHAQQGNTDAAIPLLQSLLSTDLDGSIHLQLARALTASGRRERAAEVMQKAAALQEQSQAAAAAARDRAITAP